MDHREDQKRILQSLAYSAVLLVLMWLVHGLIYILEIDKSSLANIPGHVRGLLGVLTSPWVHDDIAHLVGNSGPLFFFFAANLYYYPSSAWKAMVGIWLLTGIWVWIAAPTAAIIGASGVVYGLGAFLFFNGVFKRDRRSLMLSLVIAIFYGSMVVGIFPGKTGVSWESHLFGALAGIAMAWGFRKKDIQPRKRYQWEDEPEQEPQDESAPWNYRQNWPGSSNYYVPGESHPQDPFKE